MDTTILFLAGLIDESDRGYFKNVSHKIVETIKAKKFREAFQVTNCYYTVMNGCF